MPSGKTIQSIQTRLVDWYQAEKRDLPWRNTKDPYLIWVSEIMLQQTQVNTVIPYFLRWEKSFPTLNKLADASEHRVLKHWEGLGYYSRALNLHRAARQVVNQNAGKIPDTLAGIMALPGIGRYTAGAILSIAFDKKYPVLDGNVKRVLSRLFCLKVNGGPPVLENRLWAQAEQLLPAKNPGDFNQGLMELGATLCTPKSPDCPVCPLNKMCRARERNVQESYPPAKEKTVIKKIEVSAAVIERYGKVYIQQRPLKGLMGGLWEFPGGKIEKNETPEFCLRREIREELGVEIIIDEKLMTIKHRYTKFHVTLHVYRCRLPFGRIQAGSCEQWKWVKPRKLSSHPFPAANVKIVNHLRNNGQR